MTMISILLLLTALSFHKCESFTFEDYRNGIIQADNECFKTFISLDYVTQFKFFDASAKVPNGIIQGHFNNLGAFDECLAIDVPEKKVLGKYCTGQIAITHTSKLFFDEENSVTGNITETLLSTHDMIEKWQHIIPIRRLKDSPLLNSFKFGICVPHVCRNELNMEILKISFDESLCVTKESNSEMSTRAKVSWYVIIIFVFIGIVSTIYDIIINHKGIDPHHEILISFSFYTNGKKLCSTSKNPSQLLCLNGLKTLNMIWVIAGHTYASIIQGPIDNSLDIYEWLQNYSSMLLAGATVSVDSFFTMGGLLAVYSLLRSKDPGLKSNVKNVPMLYLHRYLRLTPALAITIYVYWSGLVNYMADGPMWYMVKSSAETCEDNWWAALLYIQNYRSEECLGQSWYLSVDMQLFLLSPLIWIPLRKWPRQTLLAMFGLAILGIVVPFGIGFYDKLPATAVGYPSNDYMTVYYLKTHARFGTYVIGMIAGYFIYHAKQKKRIQINPVAVFWLWTLTVVILYGSIYVGYPLVIKEAPTAKGLPTTLDEATRWWNSIYLALIRPAWSTALALLIYLCVAGYGGPVNWFLSTGPMQFLAKLSYCMYLNHFLFILIRIGQTRGTLHFGNWEVINILISIVVVIIPASIFQSLLFESPMISIEKIIFGRSEPRKKELKKSNEGV